MIIPRCFNCAKCEYTHIILTCDNYRCKEFGHEMSDCGFGDMEEEGVGCLFHEPVKEQK